MSQTTQNVREKNIIVQAHYSIIFTRIPIFSAYVVMGKVPVKLEIKQLTASPKYALPTYLIMGRPVTLLMAFMWLFFLMY